MPWFQKNHKTNRCLPKSPLEIDVVLDKIFEYLNSPEDLLKCRKVCRKWNVICLSLLVPILDKTPIRFEKAYSPKNRWWKREIIPKNWENLAEYSNYLKTGGIQRRNIGITEVIFNTKILLKFLKKWGETVNHVTLYWDYRAGIDKNLDPLATMIKTHCPNLKSLTNIDEEVGIYVKPRYLELYE